MKKILLLPLLLITSIVSATNYYVRTGGSDTNSGLSDQEAWEHHPWMSTWKAGRKTLLPGDVVHMKCGNSWIISAPSGPFMTVAQSGSSGKPITTTSYGTGAKPVISISGDYNYPVIRGGYRSFITIDGLDIRHWSSKFSNNGQVGIEFGGSGSNVPHDWVIKNCEIHNCPKAGIWGFTNAYNIVIGDVEADVTATESSFSNHIYDCGYGGILLSGCSYDTRESNFHIYFNYIHNIIGTTMYSPNAYGVALNSTSSSNGTLKNVYVRYNLVKDIPTWEGLDTHGGNNIYFQYNHVKNCMGGIATQAVNGYSNGLSHCYIDHNVIENPSTAYNYYFIQMQDSPTKGPENCYIGYNKLIFPSQPKGGSGYGIKAVRHTNLTIEFNHILNGIPNSGSAIQVYYPVENNIIRSNYISNWYDGIYMLGSSGDCKIHNNIICSTSSVNSALYIGKSTSSGDFMVYNNTIFCNTGGRSLLNFLGLTLSGGGVLSIKNNIIGFPAASLSGIYLSIPAIPGSSFSCDNNLYWNSSRANPFYMNSATLKWSDWNSKGSDIHGIYGSTPLFTNATGSFSKESDFRLQKNSPAINAGVGVGLTSDYYGAPIQGSPDLGAVEYQLETSQNPDYLYSVIENSAPSTLEIGFNITLANIIPAVLAFIVHVNNENRKVESVNVSGTKVLLLLSTPVKAGDIVRVTYIKPAANPLQAATGGLVESITDQLVVNKVSESNTPPVIKLSYSKTNYSGFVNEISAASSYDDNKDNISFTWITPPNVSVSATSGAKIEFLAPDVDKSTEFVFTVKASDGKSVQSKSVTLNVLPYKPELEEAVVSDVTASGYHSANYPYNIIDGDNSTMWSVDGINQWIIVELAEMYRVQHVKISFNPLQGRESYFSVQGSEDKEVWNPIITKVASCSFSGDDQVFDFPLSKSGNGFRYIKLVGMGNISDSWNYISELRIYGSRYDSPSAYMEQPVKIYPNPAISFVNVRIDDTGMKTDFIRILDSSGNIVYHETVGLEANDQIQINLNQKPGFYIVQMGLGSSTLFVQKLIITR